MPILMINGKKDHLAPIGNIYFMLENGPALGREARIIQMLAIVHLNISLIGPLNHFVG